MNEIYLTAGQRASVYTMRNNDKSIIDTQGRLNSGLRVQSAADDATKFFMASGLRNASKDLSGIKDKVSTGIKTVEGAINGLTGIKKIVEQMQGILNLVRATPIASTADRAKHIATYNALRTQINDLAGDTNVGGKNLINAAQSGSTNLIVTFNNAGTSKLTIQSTLNTATGLAINTVATWGTSPAAQTILASAEVAIAAALVTLKTNISTLGINMATLTTRNDWAASQINTLGGAADGITLADLNEEGANLSALKLRMQFGIQNLNFSGEMNQFVLRLIS